MRANRFYGACFDRASCSTDNTENADAFPGVMMWQKLRLSSTTWTTFTQTTTCQKSAENTFCDWSEEQEISSVTVMLQSCKKLSFAAKILSHIILSSNAHAVASGYYFWQKSRFSDDTTATPKWTTFSDKEPFPWAFDCTATRQGKWCYPLPKPGTSPIIRKSLWHLNPLTGKWNQWSTINPHSN